MTATAGLLAGVCDVDNQLRPDSKRGAFVIPAAATAAASTTPFTAPVDARITASPTWS